MKTGNNFFSVAKMYLVVLTNEDTLISYEMYFKIGINVRNIEITNLFLHYNKKLKIMKVH